MNKIIYVLVMSIALLLVGCSAEDRAFKKEFRDELKKLEEDPQYAEEEFIKSAIEYSVEFNNDINELQSLFENMNVTDSTWKFNVSLTAEGLTIKQNDFRLAEDYLSDDQKNKYTNTINLFNQGFQEILEIRNNIIEAQKTYDKKALQEILPKLEPANELIQKAIEQLEIERYQ